MTPHSTRRSPLVPAVALGALLLGSAPAHAAPTGTIVMQDGRRYEGVEYEVRGKNVWVKKSTGEFTYPLAIIKELIPDRSVGGPELREDGPEAGDWLARFVLEPPPGWRAAEAKMPLVRGVLRHEERDAVLRVSVRPVDVAFPADLKAASRNLPRELTDSISRSVQAFYARVDRIQPGVKTYKNTSVIRFDRLNVNGYGGGPPRILTQVRFQHDGLEYSLSYEVSKDDEGALRHQVDEVLESFSFLPALDINERSYRDYARGFELAYPDDWALDPHPFHETEPLRLITAQGRGEVIVTLAEETDADRVVRDMLEQRKKASKHLEGDRVASEERDGGKVVGFEFQDFKPGGRKKLRYKGFAALIQTHVLLFVGMSPLSDEDSAKIEAEVDAILDSIHLHDPDRIRAKLTKEKDALDFVSQGWAEYSRRRFTEASQRYDDAIGADPTYAEAYYLRGLSKKELKDFEGYEADLTKADELDPQAGYGEALASLDREKGKAALDRKDWDQAIDLLSKTYRRTKDKKAKEELQRDLDKAVGGAWDKEKKAANYYRGAKELGTKLKALRGDAPIAKILVGVYKDAAGQLAKKGEFGYAKTLATEIKGIGRANRDDKLEEEGRNLYNSLKDQQEKARKK